MCKENDTLSPSIQDLLRRMQFSVEFPSLMSLPQEVLIEICRREKKNAFMVGNPSPFGTALIKIMKQMQISIQEFASIVSLKPEFIEELLSYDEMAEYPYELLASKWGGAFVQLLHELKFSVQEWMLAPEPQERFDQPICCESEPRMTVEEAEEADGKKRALQERKEKFISSLDSWFNMQRMLNLVNILNADARQREIEGQGPEQRILH